MNTLPENAPGVNPATPVKLPVIILDSHFVRIGYSIHRCNSADYEVCLHKQHIGTIRDLSLCGTEQNALTGYMVHGRNEPIITYKHFPGALKRIVLRQQEAEAAK